MVKLAVYRNITKVLAPIAAAYVWCKGIKEPSYREGIRERQGFVQARIEPGAIWVHAASMGEAKAAIPFVHAIIDRGDRVFLSTTTPAGRRVFADAFDGVGSDLKAGMLSGQAFIPFDSPAATKRFLNAVKPKVAVLVEMELWPNLLAELERLKIPTMVISARLSERSLKRYLRLGSLIRRSAEVLSMVGAQTSADAERFIELGVPSDRVRTLGSLKFDQTLDATQLKRGRRLRLEIGVERPVWVAISVREGEEKILIAAHEQLREIHPSALLIIIPRHETQFSTVESFLPAEEDSHVFWSTGGQVPSSAAYVIADVMGEVPVFLASADVAFVGGSLVPVGGHNPLEPAALGVPVLMGPHVRNFQQIDEILAEAGGRIRVSNAEELAKTLVFLLGDASERRQIGQRAAAVFKTHKGVCERTAAAIYDMLSEQASG